jgi:hypothetical protein
MAGAAVLSLFWDGIAAPRQQPVDCLTGRARYVMSRRLGNATPGLASTRFRIQGYGHLGKTQNQKENGVPVCRDGSVHSVHVEPAQPRCIGTAPVRDTMRPLLKE